MKRFWIKLADWGLTLILNFLILGIIVSIYNLWYHYDNMQKAPQMQHYVKCIGNYKFAVYGEDQRHFVQIIDAFGNGVECNKEQK